VSGFFIRIVAAMALRTLPGSGPLKIEGAVSI
jgi:hypothetical protein